MVPNTADRFRMPSAATALAFSARAGPVRDHRAAAADPPVHAVRSASTWACVALVLTLYALCGRAGTSGSAARLRSAHRGRRTDLRSLEPVQRPAGLRQLHDLPQAVPAGLHRPGHLAVAAHRHSRPRGLGRLLLPAPGRDARHVADGVGEPSAHGLHGRRDGQLAELRPGRLPQGPAAEQRGGPEVRRLRRRCGGRHALRHEPPGRQVRHRLPARPGRASWPTAPLDPLHPARHAVRPHRLRLQAGGRAVPLLVPGRVRRGRRRGGGVPVGRFQGSGPGAAGSLRLRPGRARRASSSDADAWQRRSPLPGAGARRSSPP